MARNCREAKKELIIKAAVQVFSQKGYHSTTMAEIATVAGIGKATIYEYFESKLKLFQEMMEESQRTYYDFVEEDTQQLGIEEKIYHLIEGHIRFCRENGQLTRVIFWDAEIIDEELKDWMHKTRKEKVVRLQSIIEAGIKTNELRDMDPYMITLMISGIIASTWVPLVLEKWTIDNQDLAKKITDVIMQGIKKS